jgi:hypothetical protein
LHPDPGIDWLAQSPVTRVLEERGERIRPASADLASESGHIESESAEHDLHAFQAIRRMDEILLATFMVFHDLARQEDYDLWIGDEAWELDYYLHEDPEQKTAAYAWLTDFVGWLPMADGGLREQFLTADYNTEMIEHIARYPRVRDRAIFVGDPDDIVPDTFGPGMPQIREWTEAHYDFAGYVTGFDARHLADREALGYRQDERLCIVTVGGSGVGGQLATARDHRVSLGETAGARPSDDRAAGSDAGRAGHRTHVISFWRPRRVVPGMRGGLGRYLRAVACPVAGLPAAASARSVMATPQGEPL